MAPQSASRALEDTGRLGPGDACPWGTPTSTKGPQPPSLCNGHYPLLFLSVSLSEFGKAGCTGHPASVSAWDCRALWPHCQEGLGLALRPSSETPGEKPLSQLKPVRAPPAVALPPQSPGRQPGPKAPAETQRAGEEVNG